MALWRRLLAGSDWSHLLDVLSPALFEVVSPKQLSLRAAELAKHWFDQDGATHLAQTLDSRAQSSGLGTRIITARVAKSLVPFRSRSATPEECVLAIDGHRLLAYFFFQIYASDSVFLDLRASRFCRGSDAEPLVFRPLPLWTKWQPDFVQGIRQLYDGFYGGSESSYEQAVRELGIAPASEVFKQAFGGARKRACVYTVSGFRETFHQVFVCCRDAKVAFHPDFVTLGIAIATLYDHLETLGGTYDVQTEHERVKGLLTANQ